MQGKKGIGLEMGYPEDNFKGARGKRFGEGQTREGNGRKPNILKGLIEKFDISADDINNVFKNVIFSHTMGELQDMISGKNVKDLPAPEVMIISAILQDTKKGSLMSLMQVLDRIIGKPTQKDIIEFSDLPDNAKDRLDRIFSESQKQSQNMKPKIASKKINKKGAEE
jgi:hypothetical protein